MLLVDLIFLSLQGKQSKYVPWRSCAKSRAVKQDALWKPHSEGALRACSSWTSCSHKLGPSACDQARLVDYEKLDHGLRSFMSLWVVFKDRPPLNRSSMQTLRCSSFSPRTAGVAYAPMVGRVILEVALKRTILLDFIFNHFLGRLARRESWVLTLMTGCMTTSLSSPRRSSDFDAQLRILLDRSKI